jgi:multidrug resistance efflux pump
MKRHYRPLLIGAPIGVLLLGVTLTQAHWLLFGCAGGTPVSDPSAAAHPPWAGRIVVATGYVDVEGGITPLQALPGRVAAIAIHEDQTVTAGTVLLQMDNRQALALLRQAEADVEGARAGCDEARLLTDQRALKEAQQLAAIDATRNRLKAAEELLARREELDRAQLAGAHETRAARASVAEARAVLHVEENKLAELRLNDPKLAQRRAGAALRARQGRLEEAQLAVQECELKAPVDGTVLRIQVSKGEMLGKEPKRPAILFCPQAPRIIRAEVEQEFAPRVFLKQKVMIEDDTVSGGHWTGQVTRLSDWYTHRRSIILEPLQQNDVRTLECIITVDPGQPSLRIGQRVRVKLQTNSST